MANGTQPNPNPLPRVAVVAIHGVADQAPGNTAHRIANLLLFHRPKSHTGFVETDLRIGVEPVHLSSKSPEGPTDISSSPTFLGKVAKGFEPNPVAKSVERAQKQAVASATES